MVQKGINNQQAQPEEEEDSKTQELQSITQDNPQIEEFKELSRTEYLEYYDIASIKLFEIDPEFQADFLSNEEFKQDLFYIEHEYYYKWMDFLSNFEKMCKGALLNKMRKPEELPTFLSKRVLTLLNQMMGKLFLNEQHAKIQVYCGEIMLQAQAIAIQYLEQHPQPCIQILKKLLCNQHEKIYDSRYQDRQIMPAIQKFYAERQHYGVQSQVQGRLKENAQPEQYNAYVYYPLENEVILEYKKQQNAFYFSAFLRMQINQFYKSGGLEYICELLSKQNLIFQLDYLEIIKHLKEHIDLTIMREQIKKIQTILENVSQRISEEELKQLSKEQFQSILSLSRRILECIYSNQQLNEKIGQIEIDLILLFYRSQNLEKRIYGLQQLNEKINEINNGNNGYYNNYFQNNDWLTSKRLLEILLKEKIVDDIFEHLEMIKRSFPILRFLYEQKQLGDIVQFIRMAEGKHEVWCNVFFKMMDDLGEILLEEDILKLLDEIEKGIQIDDQKILNLLKSFGRNKNILLQLQQQQEQKKRKINKEQKNVLDEMEQENKEENIQSLKGENLLIKIHQDGQESKVYEYKTNNRKQYQGSKQQQQENDSDETNCDEDQQQQDKQAQCNVQQRILDLIRYKYNKHKNGILLYQELICSQFKQLRFEYLMKSLHQMHNLQQIDWNINIIQKIIQSQYPIQTNTGELLKTQLELVKFIDLQYNLKVQILQWISKLKQSFLQDNNINLQQLESYYPMLKDLLSFYLFIFQSLESKIDTQHIKILWQIVFDNAFTFEEQNLFFQWLHTILYQARTINQPLILTNESIQLIFFEYLIKIHPDSYTIQMFHCLYDLIIHFNLQYKLIKPYYNTYAFNSSELVGLDVLWHLYYNTTNPSIITNTKDTLLAILQFQGANQTIKSNYINKIFSSFTNQLLLSKSIDFLQKILEEVEGLKMHSNSDYIVITIDNKTRNSLPPKKQDIHVNTSMTIAELKLFIANKLNPPLKQFEFDLVNRGNWLKDHNTLKDYKFENNLTVMVTPSKNLDDPNFIGPRLPTNAPIPLPKSNKQVTYSGAPEPSNNQIDEKIQAIQDFTQENQKEFIKHVLQQKQWNEEEVINDFLDENMKQQHFLEWTGKQQQQTNSNQNQNNQNNNMEEIVSIAQLIAKNHENIENLFQLFIDYPQFSEKIWQILQLIPRSKLVESQVEAALNEQYQWSELLSKNNSYKLYYNLQILKDFLHSDQRQAQRINFINNGGLEEISKLIHINKDALEIYCMYHNAYLLSNANPKQKYELNRLISLKDTLRDEDSQTSFFGVPQYTLSSATNSSNLTPTFNSVGTTPPLTPPDQEQQQQQQQEIKQKDEYKILIEAFKQQQEIKVFDDKSLVLELFSKISQANDISVSLLLTTIYMQPILFKEMYQINNLREDLLQILMYCQDELFRRIIAFTIMTICKIVIQDDKIHLINEDQQLDELFQKNSVIDPRLYFLKSYVPLVEDQTIQNCQSEDLFVVVANLLSQMDITSLHIDFDQLFSKLTDFVVNRDIVEDRFRENEDKLIQGYLRLMCSLLKIRPNLKNNLPLKQIYDYLFFMPQDVKKQELLLHPKFKRTLTRKRAFEFLVESCRQNEENFLALLDPITHNHDEFDHVDPDWVNQNVKGSHGFVGLNNLGCTCYVNSLIQNFFMIPSLRAKILESELSFPKKEEFLSQQFKEAVNILKKYEDQLLRDGYYVFKSFQLFDEHPVLQLLLNENSLYQLQYLLAQLQESVKQSINPKRFINSIKGFDGQAINYNVQQDVNEFFNLLMDKLEQNLKGTSNPKILEEFMGGKLSNEIQSLEEEFAYQKETEEPFLTVTLEIKHKRCLEEALDLFVKGDILEGENKYFCEQYDQKIKAVKRCYFKELPEIFVITLKRFEFDFNTMLKVKVNDYFEFPREIDLSKWCTEGTEPQNYNLIGVLVHVGSADAGHYYSFIKNGKEWLEFNDQRVTSFNPDRMKQECFGGAGDQDIWEQTKNAYILFYSKQDVQQVQPSQRYAEYIWQDNLKFLRNILFYSQDYLTFVKDFICQFNFPELSEVKLPYVLGEQYTNMPALKVIKLMTMFSYETLMKNSDVQQFTNSMQTVLTLYQKFLPGSFWLIDYIRQNDRILKDLLLDHQSSEVKTNFAKLVTYSIGSIVKAEEDYIPDQSLIVELLKQSNDVVSKLNLKKSSEFLQVMRFTVSQSPKLVQYFYSSEIVTKYYRLLIEVVKENQGSFTLNITKLTEKGLESAVVNLLEVVVKTLLGSVTEGMLEGNEATPVYLFKQSEWHDLVRFNKDLLRQMMDIKNYKNYLIPLSQLNNSVLDLTIHLCYCDIKNSDKIIKQLLSILIDVFINWQQIDCLFHIINKILQISDQYQDQRVQLLFSKINEACLKGDNLIQAIKNMQNSDKNYSINCIKWLVEIANSCVGLRKYILENDEIFRDMLEFLLINGNNIIVQILPNIVNKIIQQLQGILMIEVEQRNEADDNINIIINEERDRYKEDQDDFKNIRIDKQVASSHSSKHVNVSEDNNVNSEQDNDLNHFDNDFQNQLDYQADQDC